jgi:hypothetical protein
MGMDRMGMDQPPGGRGVLVGEMTQSQKAVRAASQTEIHRVLKAAQKAGLEVFGYVVNGPEIRVITKDKEPSGDDFDMVDFAG